jgi:hypothetical protein
LIKVGKQGIKEGLNDMLNLFPSVSSSALPIAIRGHLFFLFFLYFLLKMQFSVERTSYLGTEQ